MEWIYQFLRKSLNSKWEDGVRQTQNGRLRAAPQNINFFFASGGIFEMHYILRQLLRMDRIYTHIFSIWIRKTEREVRFMLNLFVYIGYIWSNDYDEHGIFYIY